MDIRLKTIICHNRNVSLAITKLSYKNIAENTFVFSVVIEHNLRLCLIYVLV